MNYIADTNIIVRLLVQDHPEQIQALDHLIRSGKANLLITSQVVIETCWVLQSYFNVPRDKIARALLAMLQTDEVINEDEDVEEALELFSNQNVDILDAYLAIRSRKTKTPVLSWDKDFRKLECESYTPSEL